MGFSLDVSVSVLTVFLQGILSFFSPCVLPLLPLYLGYLSGGASGAEEEDGRRRQARTALHTFCFVLGISFAFFALGLGVSAAGTFLRNHQVLFSRIGGVLIVLFGLYQLGVFGSSRLLGTERRLPFSLERFVMSPVTALIMGFTFSFAWTPCVGPALTSVLLLAASAGTRGTGFALIGVYTLGFVLPFLAAGFFTTSLLGLFRKHMGVVRYTVKIGGVLMILMGVFLFTGRMNEVTGYLSRLGTSAGGTETVSETAGADETEGAAGADAETEAAPEAAGDGGETEADGGAGLPEESGEETETALMPALDFELKDQYGTVHRLEDYAGKTIFLNFWGTWCPPCRAEMPDIQRLYETYDTEGDDALIVLGVAAPLMGQETSEEGIAEFLEENGYTYPVLMDTEWELFEGYGIYSFPTTFMIDRDGNVFGYVSGMLTYEFMEDIISQTMEGVRR